MKFAIKPILIILVLFIGGYLFYKHSGYFPYEHNPMQYMPNMHRTKSIIPERGYSFFEDQSGSRVPPAGTLGIHQKTYPYTKADSATDVEKKANPLANTREVVLRGQKLYMTYCVVCHGPGGNGNGSIVPPFPQPPSLHSDKIRGYVDSQIFHVITAGQNMMPSYASQIRENDRWSIIHYVRVLQKAENPSPADLAAFEKLLNEPEEQK